jgi:short-subunit dehydrogenase
MTARQLVVITGANSGIGAEPAVLHATRGDDVAMVNRSVERSRPVIDRIEHESPTVRVDVVQADLDDHDSIAAASQQLRERGPIDIFYNSAGVLLGKLQMSKHGIEMHAEVKTPLHDAARAPSW